MQHYIDNNYGLSIWTDKNHKPFCKCLGSHGIPAASLLMEYLASTGMKTMCHFSCQDANPRRKGAQGKAVSTEKHPPRVQDEQLTWWTGPESHSQAAWCC